MAPIAIVGSRCRAAMIVPEMKRHYCGGAAKLKLYAKNLTHLTLPEIVDFNALDDA